MDEDNEDCDDRDSWNANGRTRGVQVEIAEEKKSNPAANDKNFEIFIVRIGLHNHPLVQNGESNMEKMIT